MKPLQVLQGHTTIDTAFVVNDYPYGFRLRCKIRYWLEYAKGKGDNEGVLLKFGYGY